MGGEKFPGPLIEVFGPDRQGDFGTLWGFQFFKIKIYFADNFIGKNIAKDRVLCAAVQGFAVQRDEVWFILFFFS